jgi:hypothetical protein
VLSFKEVLGVAQRVFESPRGTISPLCSTWTMRSFLRLSLANSEFAVIFHPRDQDELSQSFDFPIFKRCNQIETGLFKRERV